MQCDKTSNLNPIRDAVTTNQSHRNEVENATSQRGKPEA